MKYVFKYEFSTLRSSNYLLNTRVQLHSKCTSHQSIKKTIMPFVSSKPSLSPTRARGFAKPELVSEPKHENHESNVNRPYTSLLAENGIYIFRHLSSNGLTKWLWRKFSSWICAYWKDGWGFWFYRMVYRSEFKPARYAQWGYGLQ